jgi:hypothetical protein
LVLFSSEFFKVHRHVTVGKRELPLVKVIAEWFSRRRLPEFGLDQGKKRLLIPAPETGLSGEKGASGQRSVNCKRKVSQKLRLKDVTIAAEFYGRFHNGGILKASEKYDFRR